ncbi:MAG: MFS transporter, partial [candidate division WOR-3 bacterium]
MINQKERERSLKFSLLDGIFASINAGFTQSYITPFALLLKATNFQIGILNSLPQFISSFFQIPSADIVEKLKSRVKIIANSIYFQGLFWLLISFLAFLNNSQFAFLIFLILLIFHNSFSAFATPIWQSLMSDTVDKDKYGRYFAYRGKVLGFITLIANFAAGFILFLLSQNKILGFFIIFLIAGISRI